jgi:hypothetical protein
MVRNHLPGLLDKYIMSTLIVGCSFIDNLGNNPLYTINREQWKTKGSAGAGNQAISARVIYECAKNQYDEVLVLWSGINRLDCPIGRPLHATMPVSADGNPKYKFYSKMDDVIWYHSGGFFLSGCSIDSPPWFRDWCITQYKSCTPQYLTELTLQSIINTQGFLNTHGVPYRMSFIYDIDADYESNGNWPGRQSGVFILPSCGKIDRSSRLTNLVDWSKFIQHQSPHEYARDSMQLEDGFHPTYQGMSNWFKSALDIDLTT